jgi:hypothetical protein
VLGAKVPVINPNYYSASVSGNLSISYYDVAAGWQDFSASIPARSFPTPVRVRVDASNLPGKYTAVVIGNCLNFPRRIIFFLTAAFRVRLHVWRGRRCGGGRMILLPASLPSPPFPPPHLHTRKTNTGARRVVGVRPPNARLLLYAGLQRRKCGAQARWLG